jgi:hypothetical protein
MRLPGIYEELALLRDTLDTRYDELKSGRVQPIDGDEAFAESIPFVVEIR